MVQQGEGRNDEISQTGKVRSMTSQQIADAALIAWRDRCAALKAGRISAAILHGVEFNRLCAEFQERE